MHSYLRGYVINIQDVFLLQLIIGNVTPNSLAVPYVAIKAIAHVEIPFCLGFAILENLEGQSVHS